LCAKLLTSSLLALAVMISSGPAPSRSAGIWLLFSSSRACSVPWLVALLSCSSGLPLIPTIPTVRKMTCHKAHTLPHLASRCRTESHCLRCDEDEPLTIRTPYFYTCRRVRGSRHPPHRVRQGRHHHLPQGFPLRFPYAFQRTHTGTVLLPGQAFTCPLHRRHGLFGHLNHSRVRVARGSARRPPCHGSRSRRLQAHALVDLDLLHHLVVHPGPSQGTSPHRTCAFLSSRNVCVWHGNDNATTRVSCSTRAGPRCVLCVFKFESSASLSNTIIIVIQ
jgi:hypothetical protein